MKTMRIKAAVMLLAWASGGCMGRDLGTVHRSLAKLRVGTAEGDRGWEVAYLLDRWFAFEALTPSISDATGK